MKQEAELEYLVTNESVILSGIRRDSGGNYWATAQIDGTARINGKSYTVSTEWVDVRLKENLPSK